MTLTEVVCAIWVFAVLGSAGLFGWSQAVQTTALTVTSRAAADCADDAAEVWLAGQTPATAVSVNGRSCAVQLIPPKPGEEAVMTIVAQVEQSTQTLLVPVGPL